MNGNHEGEDDETRQLRASVCSEEEVDQGANWAPPTRFHPDKTAPLSFFPHLIVAGVTRQIIAFCSSARATVFGEWRMDSEQREDKRSHCPNGFLKRFSTTGFE